MSRNTLIEWTGDSENAGHGCERISPGCENCYIPTTPPFRMSGNRFDRDGVGASTRVDYFPARLDALLRDVTPRLIFLNSLTDTFLGRTPVNFIARTFATMLLTPHTYQVLTKRHARMRALLSHAGFVDLVRTEAMALGGLDGDGFDARFGTTWWPLRNVWTGVSVENEQFGRLRVPYLLRTPAHLRWLSVEPLLGPVDLRPWIAELDWVVVGGESGAGARPAQLAWIRDVVEVCAASGTPVYTKQLGTHWRNTAGAAHPKGGDPHEWPADLRVRQLPDEHWARVLAEKAARQAARRAVASPHIHPRPAPVVYQNQAVTPAAH